MLVSRNLEWKLILFYTWKDLLYYTILAFVVFMIHDYYQWTDLSIPFNAIAALSTALAIFLGFKNNNAYDRWWEARKVWGKLVNYSRAWEREVKLMIDSADPEDKSEVADFQRKLIYRHLAFINALRVFLRKPSGYVLREEAELFQEENEYAEVKKFLEKEEYIQFYHKKNPPNFLLDKQGEDLKMAYKKGWINEFHLVRLEETLITFNDIQGMCERIKNTPFMRQYSYFSRVFVFIHASIIPFAFVGQLHLAMMPLTVVISFVFLALDLIGERTEDPFENRLEDVSMSALCNTIEINLKESLGENNLPPKMKANEQGVLL